MSFYLNGQLYDSSNISSLYDASGQLKSGADFSGNTSVGSAIGNFQNAMDMITQQSEKASARSLEYAQQNQQWAAEQAQIANNFNAAEAAKNRDWQEYMSNTAHQREIADLKAAGLNPVLSAMGGNGAAVTSGASASANLPSGAVGQSDMSANSALVSVLGSMLAAQTALTNQAVSARTQEAVAEKYTAMSYLTAEIAAAASRYGSELGLAGTKYSSELGLAGTKYSSDNSRAANLLSSLLGLEGTKYSANSAKAASRYSADSSREASKYAADQGFAGSQYSADKNFAGRLWQEGIGEFGDAIGELIHILPSLLGKTGRIGF